MIDGGLCKVTHMNTMLIVFVQCKGSRGGGLFPCTPSITLQSIIETNLAKLKERVYFSSIKCSLN